MKKYRIVITGSSGFIGKNLLAALLNRDDATVYTTTRNNIFNVVKDVRPHILYHLAGNPLVSTLATGDEALNLHYSNIYLTHKLLTLVPKKCLFVYASSVTVYGDYERKNSEEVICNPKSLYAATKLASENLITAYHNLKLVNGLILRFVANVGKYATHGVLLDVYNKMISNKLEIELLGKYPGSIKPFMHVDDTVAAMLYLSFKKTTGIFNVGPQDELSIDELVKIVQKELGITKHIIWKGADSLWAGDNPKVQILNGRLRAFGFKQKYESSTEAITQAIRDIHVQ